MSTIVHALLSWAERRPEATCFSFLGDGEGVRTDLSYEALHQGALDVAAALVDRRLQGEPVLLAFPPGLELVKAFFGCLYAGALAVPLPLPRARGEGAELHAINRSARSKVLLTESRTRAALSRFCGLDIEVIAVDLLDRASAHAPRPPRTDATAFLQYTSGSTSSPRGVMVSHGNLADNLRVIRDAFDHDASSKGLTWLPLFHDMGLIGHVLEPVWVGFPCVFMSPLHFLQRPRRWLEAIGRERATTSGAPNFAYRACLAALGGDPIDDLDLRSWRVAFCGAEPISAATMRAFAARLAPAGFASSALYPCYGLAEATLFVSGGATRGGVDVTSISAEDAARGEVRADPAPASSREVVACGWSRGENTIAIVDPESKRRLPDGNVGEIWVAGPSVARGYWNDPEATAESFDAILPGEEARYLRTGDLGALLGGRLIVSGRSSDRMIVRGRNHYPADVERIVIGAMAPARPRVCAVFQTEGNEPRIVAVVEAGRRPDAGWGGLAAAARRAVTTELGVAIDRLVIARAGAIPKTSSGKVKRRVCRQLLDLGELPILHEEMPEDARLERPAESWIEENVAAVFADVLGVEAPGRTDDLLLLGGDSLSATRVAARLGERFGIQLGVAEVMERGTVSALAEIIEARVTSDAPATILPTNAGEGIASFAQERIWFLEQVSRGGAYNMTCAFHLDGPLAAEAVELAMRALVARHEVMRTALEDGSGVLRQRVLTVLETAVEVIDLSGLPPGIVAEHLARSMTAEASAPFDLAEGKVLRARLYRLGAARHVLQATLHHVAGDAWSFKLALRDFARSYRGLVAGTPESPAPTSVRYLDFAAWQRRSFDEARAAAARTHWQAALRDARPARLPHRGEELGPRSVTGPSISLCIPRPDPAQEALLRRAGITPYATLLACLQIFLGHVAAQDDVVIGVQTSSRPPGLDGVLGCFVNTLALRTRLEPGDRFIDVAERARATVAAALAHQDVPFQELVRWLAPARANGATPLISVLLDHEPDWPPRLSLPCVEARHVEVERERLVYDLVLLLRSDGPAYTGWMVYAEEAFDAETVGVWARRFAAVAAAAWADLHAPVADIVNRLRTDASAERRTARHAYRSARRRALVGDGSPGGGTQR